MKQFYAIFLFFIILFSFDNLLFEYLYWEIPDESPWSTNFFYGYEYQYRNLESRFKESKKKKILLLGSSIAAYSLHPLLIKKELKEKYQIDAEVEILSFAGMTPFDVYMLKSKIYSLSPDLVVYPINFIDYRIHRNFQINPGKNSSETTDEEFLLNDSLDYGNAPQSKLFYPLETILEFYNILDSNKIAEYFTAYLFKSIRYRDIFYENFRLYYNHRFGRNTSYHGYMGTEIPEAIDSIGWTGKNFSFTVKDYMKIEGFYIQIVPEILKTSELQIKFYNDKNQLIQEEIFHNTGWKKIILNNKIIEGQIIRAELSDSWFSYQAMGDRFDFQKDEMGVRLQQNFGRIIPDKVYHFIREPRKEDYRYLEMDKIEYENYFNYRLLDNYDKRPGLTYFHSIRNAKIQIRDEDFTPSTQLKYLKKFIKFTKNNNIKVLLINNPENPLTLDIYKEGIWYRGKLKYLSLLQGGSVTYLDWKDLLSPQDFSDFHHFTYPAMEKMTPSYAKEIVNKIGTSSSE